MDLDRRTCDRARRSRDARFDGRFFIGVTTTGIYCRPICPSRTAKAEHVRYFSTAAAAEAAGFRPCLRCRPEASPGTPAWLGTSGLVSRALRLIGEGGLDDDGVERLADRLGVTGRHVRRLFLRHLGATPRDVALTRRVHFAKKLLDETTLGMSQVAMASGFGSVRRFNSQIHRTFARTPTELRRLAQQRGLSDRRAEPAGQMFRSGIDCYRFRLAYRPPYDWDSVLAFLAPRATPGVESVEDGFYRRTIQVDVKSGVIEVRHLQSASALSLAVRFPDPQVLLFIVERVRRMFDLRADPAVITEQLRSDPLLRKSLARHPGIRTPGAWNGFELAVRAILGQQVSVRAATTLAGRLSLMFGVPVNAGAGLEQLFPSPAQLANAPIERAGVMPARAETIRSLARRIMNRTIELDGCVDGRATACALRSVPGIGDWTAEYIAMRALGEPDAFPSGDLGLRRAAGARSVRELEGLSEAWRPWRAYAVMLLWQQLSDDGVKAAELPGVASAIAPRVGSTSAWRMKHALGDDFS